MSRLVSAPEAYRLWAESFDAGASPILALETRHLEPLLGDVAGRRVIDAGCGTGRWLAWAHARGARIAGADFSPEMLRVASQKSRIAGNLVLADGRRLPFPAAFADIVLCTLAIGHMQPVAAAMAELARLARPGGRVIVSDFHPAALRLGWKRTFRCGSATCEIESAPYSVAALSHAALELEDLRELHFGEPERPWFDAAGKGGKAFDDACRTPAVLLACFRRRLR